MSRTRCTRPHRMANILQPHEKPRENKTKNQGILSYHEMLLREHALFFFFFLSISYYIVRAYIWPFERNNSHVIVIFFFVLFYNVPILRAKERSRLSFVAFAQGFFVSCDVFPLMAKSFGSFNRNTYWNAIRVYDECTRYVTSNGITSVYANCHFTRARVYPQIL